MANHPPLQRRYDTLCLPLVVFYRSCESAIVGQVVRLQDMNGNSIVSVNPGPLIVTMSFSRENSRGAGASLCQSFSVSSPQTSAAPHFFYFIGTVSGNEFLHEDAPRVERGQTGPNGFSVLPKRDIVHAAQRLEIAGFLRRAVRLLVVCSGQSQRRAQVPRSKEAFALQIHLDGPRGT